MVTYIGMQDTHRDRLGTMDRILESLGEIVSESGFEKVGINSLSARAGVSKVLVYRYFGSLEGAIAAYIGKNDFWINFSHPLPESGADALSGYLKGIFRDYVRQLQENKALRRLYRWELSDSSGVVTSIRDRREKTGTALIRRIAEMTGKDIVVISSAAALISAAVTYLVMLGDFWPVYNGIPLRESSGWDALLAYIDRTIDMVLTE